ncbi:hypothetical protein [Acinetobacter sp. Ac_5812]|nr:hypothetical protein [Acinetobacter sp. Ac_5812]
MSDATKISRFSSMAKITGYGFILFFLGAIFLFLLNVADILIQTD